MKNRIFWYPFLALAIVAFALTGFMTYINVRARYFPDPPFEGGHWIKPSSFYDSPPAPEIFPPCWETNDVCIHDAEDTTYIWRL
jgi:hypothetical protein